MTANAAVKPVRWRGVALGARATMILYHPNPAFAREVIETNVAEIERLEQVFSLYRMDSALSRLNRDGELRNPPLDLVRLLSEAKAFGARTGGAFDMTVQPLWQLYATHFGAADADPAGPPRARIEAARSLVDFRAVEIDADIVTLGRPGMAVTLNGIAQGYVTDRVGDLLRDRGFEHVLIDLGETKALGPKPDGQAWRVGIANPTDPDSVLRTFELSDSAVATSAPSGTRFDLAGRHQNLFDPQSGGSSQNYSSVTVLDDSATKADALSTAIAVAAAARTRSLVDALRPTQVVLIDAGGRVSALRPS
ncbi:MAG: FAD:protein FMN transferase [bacterium]|nr:FAD:protein FMN transferase [bacterium]